MANSDSPFGLRPVGHALGLSWSDKVRPYFVASGVADLFIGDPVVKVAGGSNTAQVEVPGVGTAAIGTLPSITKATAGDVPGTGTPITGVIVGFAANPDNLSTVYGPTGANRVAFVCDDPFVIFEIQADGAIPAASIGLNAVLIYTHSGSTFTGLSGAELDTTSTAPSVDASNQLLILRAVNREDNDTTLTHAKVEVLINQHTQNPGSTGIAGI